MHDLLFTQIEADRIRLRRFQSADLAAFVAYRNDPEVARYQSWTSISDHEAQQFIEELKESHPGTPGEWFQFAIERKADGQLIGDCALHTKADEHSQGEVGYTLARAYQHQGYATEAITTLFEYAFSRLQLHRIIALADCRNTASIALMARLGMRCEGHFKQSFWSKGEWTDEVQYAILQEEWLKRH